MNNRPTPETDAFSGYIGDWIKFAEKLERERDEAREQNAYLRCIAERAIDYLDQAYRDGFSDEANELRYELKQLEEAAK